MKLKRHLVVAGIAGAIGIGALLYNAYFKTERELPRIDYSIPHVYKTNEIPKIPETHVVEITKNLPIEKVSVETKESVELSGREPIYGQNDETYKSKLDYLLRSILTQNPDIASLNSLLCELAGSAVPDQESGEIEDIIMGDRGRVVGRFSIPGSSLGLIFREIRYKGTETYQFHLDVPLEYRTSILPKDRLNRPQAFTVYASFSAPDGEVTKVDISAQLHSSPLHEEQETVVGYQFEMEQGKTTLKPTLMTVRKEGERIIGDFRVPEPDEPYWPKEIFYGDLDCFQQFLKLVRVAKK